MYNSSLILTVKKNCNGRKGEQLHFENRFWNIDFLRKTLKKYNIKWRKKITCRFKYFFKVCHSVEYSTAFYLM